MLYTHTVLFDTGSTDILEFTWLPTILPLCVFEEPFQKFPLGWIFPWGLLCMAHLQSDGCSCSSFLFSHLQSPDATGLIQQRSLAQGSRWPM